MDADLCWTQIYVGHRYMLDTDLRWSTGPSWTTFSTIFGLFPGGPRSVPRTFFINGKVLQIGSRGVLGWFWKFFSEVFRKVPRSFSRTPGRFWGLLEKIGLGPLGAPWAPHVLWGGLGDCLMRIPIQTPDQRPGWPLLVCRTWRPESALIYNLH